MKQILNWVISVTVLALVSCKEELYYDFSLTNASRVDIGFFAKENSSIKVNNILLNPMAIYDNSIPAVSTGSIPTFKISNVIDTTSIVIPINMMERLIAKKLTTAEDSIVSRSLIIHGTLKYQWTVTDELVDIMKHDECLLTEFSYYYSNLAQ